MLREPARRRRWLIRLGVVVTVGFVFCCGRPTSTGDPAPWALHDNLSATVLSFLNTEKYPPSALYLAMTLGPTLVALAWFELARGKLARLLIIFGRVPLFYYVAHLLLLHTLAVVSAAAIFLAVACRSGPRPSPRVTGWDCPAYLPGRSLSWRRCTCRAAGLRTSGAGGTMFG